MLEKIFQPDEIESKFTKLWETTDVAKAKPESPEKPFTIMMPPPNVTGSLHIGHALNHTLQDILSRYKRMQGYDVLWQPGTDHASIAVHMVLEKQLAEQGKNRHDMGREKFLEKAWEWKDHSGGQIKSQLKRLGTTPDWSRERFTMDDGLSRAVLKVFKDLYDDGLIYRARKLVNWDPERKTVISDLEVDQVDKKGHLWHIQYPIEGEEARTITVATTRPETMLGDTAVAVHPDDERYKDLVGKFVSLPLADRMIPIVADNHADPEHGSGAVKITPAHDFNDFEVGRRHDLELINILNEDGTLNDNVPEKLRGLDRFEARKAILQELEELDLLEKVEDIQHSVPYGQRSGVVIEPFLTDQWFCDTPTLAKDAAEAVRNGDTKFVPKQYENMYFDWVDNQIPWCISRQLWWGHRIPAWYGPDDEVFVAETEDEALKLARKHYGKDVVELRQDEDVLDTWFSSALWSFSTLGWPDKTKEIEKYYPTDVLVTGFDIITFWVSRMMMMSLYFMKDVPFREVYVHALVKDAKGQKMSKSKGNVVDPLDIIEKYGADALRFTLTAMAAQGRDIKLSESRIEGYRNFATKLWNAARYCQMKECYPSPGYDPSSLALAVNQWIVTELKKTADLYQKALESYKFNEAANILYQFTWGTFCDWYLEFTKPVLNEESDETAITEIRRTTGWVLDQILVLLNPIMPFITEELYESMGQRNFESHERRLLLQAKWPEIPDVASYQSSVSDIVWLIRFISEIRSVRADMNVPAGAKIQLQIKDANKTTKARINTFDHIIRLMARLEGISELQGDIPKGALQTVLDEATLIMPVADIINIDEEKARLKKEIDKLNQTIKKFDQKLENKKFLENAPEDVVEEQRHRKREAQETLEKLSRALSQIEAA